MEYCMKGNRFSVLDIPMHGKHVMSAQISEVSLLGVGTVLRLERDAWSIVK